MFKKNYKKNNDKLFLSIFVINLLFVVLWFLIFPLYRFGISLLFIFIILASYFIFIRHIDFIKIKKYYNFFIIFIILGFTGLLIKNFNRISNKIDDPILPHMYDDKVHSNITKKFINSKNQFTHYTKEDSSLCGYSISPCSEKKDQKLRIKNIYNYKLYYIYKH